MRALFFDKLAGANWHVGWHHDLSIAVAERVEVPGFTGWSVKQGVTHVQPPASVLENMLTLRVHLDDCAEDNGPLRVMRGSHQHGRLTDEQIEQWQRKGEEVMCLVPKGAVLLMGPLLLHASAPAKNPRHRRVIHLEYAANPLPGGLQWFEQTATILSDANVQNHEDWREMSTPILYPKRESSGLRARFALRNLWGVSPFLPLFPTQEGGEGRGEEECFPG